LRLPSQCKLLYDIFSALCRIICLMFHGDTIVKCQHSKVSV